MNDTQNTTTMLGGFLLGAAVGAGLAVLFAPAPGTETRRQIGETARRLGTGAQDKLENLRHGAQDKMEGLRHAVTDGAHGVKAAVKEGRDVYRRESNTSLATSDAP